MADSDTLLAFMIPRLTNQAENAATDALAYILNNSSASLQALNGLVEEGSLGIEPITRVATQVTYGRNSRPDAVCYDNSGEARVIVESKFWASLLDDQASGYIEHLSESGLAVLLFVVPDARIDTLWASIKRQVENGDDGKELEALEPTGRIQRARVAGSERLLMIISWRILLERMLHRTREVGQTPGVEADIRQLQGLTERMDLEEMQPLQEYEFSPAFARRMRDLRQIYDDVVGRWRNAEWIGTQGLSASGQLWTGYGRFLKLSGYESWFGIFYNIWAEGDSEDTPLWLQLYSCTEFTLEQIAHDLGLRLSGDPRRAGAKKNFVPIRLKRSAERVEVIDDIMQQLEEINRIIAAYG